MHAVERKIIKNALRKIGLDAFLDELHAVALELAAEAENEREQWLAAADQLALDGIPLGDEECSFVILKADFTRIAND